MLSITVIIVIITSGFSLLCFTNKNYFEKSLFIPYRIKNDKEYWRLFTHMFAHGDEMHLIFNMLSFYSFGEMIEQTFVMQYGYVLGKSLFVVLYFGAGLFAEIYPYYRNKNNITYRSLGASGAVSAIIFSFIMMNPTAELSLFFLPIPMPAIAFGVIYLGFEIYAHKQNKSGIAHDAHIGGAIFGILFTVILFPQVVQDLINMIF